jgi:voltage-gated potassium channel
VSDQHALSVEEIEEASTLDDAERAELQNPGYEIFIAALSVLSILNLLLMSFIDDADLEYVLLVMNALLSGILFLDFCVRLKTAESRSDYFFRKFGWADLLASVPVAQFKILRVFRLIRVYRLLKEYGVRNIGQSLVAERAGSALLTLLLVAILVLEFGSLGMLAIESDAPGANIKTASDSLWYIIVTMSTVGYGDQYPVTNPGRVLGTFIIVLGVGIFGTLTGYLANLFLTPRRSRKAAAAAAESAESGESAGEPDADVPTAMAEAVPGAADSDPLDLRLSRLHRAGELRDSGVLSADEFERTKAEILAG